MKSLDLNGVNHWAWMSYAAYEGDIESSSFKTFGSFTDSLVDEVDGSVDGTTYDGKEPIAVFIACFESTNNTAYAVFNGGDANFGNEYVKKLIIPGKIGAKIVEPSLVPAYNQEESRTLFMGWDKVVAGSSEGENSGNETPANPTLRADAEEEVYGAKNTVVTYNADPEPYKYMITFYNGSEVVGTFYYYSATPNSNDGIDNGLVAFQYNGKVYAKSDVNTEAETKNEATKAYLNIIEPSKDGYEIKQWNDSDKNAMITFTKDETDKTETIIDKVNIKDMKDDLNLYAQFEPKDYLIIYYANTATASNTMVQVGTVDEGLALFGESTFGNEGYVLKEWNTRPDGKGTSYALGSDFTLNGSAYKDASKTPTGVDGVPTGYDKCVTLYAIWEKVGGNGSGNEPGNNSDGGNTDTYLLAGILIVIIVLIIVVAVVLRKKQ